MRPFPRCSRRQAHGVEEISGGRSEQGELEGVVSILAGASVLGRDVEESGPRCSVIRDVPGPSG